jgi:hypothetical protein
MLCIHLQPYPLTTSIVDSDPVVWFLGCGVLGYVRCYDVHARSSREHVTGQCSAKKQLAALVTRA